jgi:hypothetical protein
MALTWYDARIRDGHLWQDWPAGTKVLVAHATDKLAVGPFWWVFNGKHLRAVVDPLARSTFVMKKQHSDQELCADKVRPFLNAKRADRMGLAGEPKYDGRAAVRAIRELDLLKN